MVGRNVLGLQPVGERLLAKISSLYVLCVMFIFVVYLIIFDICIFYCAYLLAICCAWHVVYLFYVVAWILINACGYFMIVFGLNIVRNRDLFKELNPWTVGFLAYGWLAVLDPI
jgi:hypothetical protein